MIRVSSATEDEVILAFLRAERYSSRFGEHVESGIGGRWNLLDTPNLDDGAENAARRQVLGNYRGYGLNTALFRGFPRNVEWWNVEMSKSDVLDLYYGRNAWGVGGPQVRDVAGRADLLDKHPETNEAVQAVVRGVRGGATFEPIVVVAQSPDDRHILVEGYVRATAFADALPVGQSVVAIAGYSETLANWDWF